MEVNKNGSRNTGGAGLSKPIMELLENSFDLSELNMSVGQRPIEEENTSLFNDLSLMQEQRSKRIDSLV
jgi:hypothetical protein